MNIKVCANPEAKRAGCVTVVAENEVEQALLWRLYLALQSEPPCLAEWQIDVMEAVRGGAQTSAEVAEICGLKIPCANNRLMQLWKLGLLSRTLRAGAPNLHFYVYSIQERAPGEAEGFRDVVAL